MEKIEITRELLLKIGLWASFAWLILSFIIGAVGSNKKIGFWGAFFISLFFSPFIGLLFTLVSKTRKALVYEESLLQLEEQILLTVKQLNTNNASVNLKKVKDLMDSGVISSEDYEKMKEKIIQGSVSGEAGKSSSEMPVYIEVYEGTTRSMVSGPYKKFKVEFADGKAGELFQNLSSNEYKIVCKDIPVYYSKRESAIEAIYHNNLTGEILETNRIYL